MSRIVIVSNRVADAAKSAQAGGVAVALSDVVMARRGVWAGWDGHVVERAEQLTIQTRRRRRATVVTTPLTAEEHYGFYLGYANSVLWPVFHNRLDLAQFEAGYYRIYQEVNARMAQLVAPLLEPDDLLWVHDYQFITLGIELRRLGVQNPMGFFLHIPFPPAQSFLAVPEHRELAEAFAAYDLVGLQTSVDVANMLSYMQHVNGRLLPDGRIRAFDRIVAIESYPIGIDPADFDEAAGEQAGRGALARPDMIHITGIDRLDYTKGLPQKFRAFGRFLDMAPQYRGKVILTQIAPPTRESVEAYTDIRKELEALSGSINGRFGELDWVPIHYIHRSVARSRLGDIYRASRIGLVTPLRDGMNLVAKEYVAAQDPEDPGVLVLSQFTGAAEQLKDALIVNPYNIEEMARGVLAAIEMPLSERVERHAKLLESVRRNDIRAWSDSFVSALARFGRLSRKHESVGDITEQFSRLVPQSKCDVQISGGAGRRRKPAMSQR
jgi:trehalose 6-phosphate synthase